MTTINNSAKNTNNASAFYFANSKNDERAIKGGKVRFYGPFESKTEAEAFGAYHGAPEAYELTNEEREDAQAMGVIFHDLYRAAYFVDGVQVTPGAIAKIVRKQILG